MMRAPKPLLALALLAATPFVAGAGELDYDYLELGYTRVTGSPKIDGATVNGSAALGDSLQVLGGVRAPHPARVNHALGLRRVQ